MVTIPNEILDGFLLSDRTREDIVMLADALEELYHPASWIVRHAEGVTIESRGRGYFVGFIFPSSAAPRPDVNEITYQLATRALRLGNRLVA